MRDEHHGGHTNMIELVKGFIPIKKSNSDLRSICANENQHKKQQDATIMCQQKDVKHNPMIFTPHETDLCGKHQKIVVDKNHCPDQPE